MNKHLHDVVEVIEISDMLDIEVACTVGHLHRFWSFVDDNSVDGRISLSERQVDKLTRPGFATALLLVGWLLGESGDFTVPNFDRYNPNPAKGRKVPQAHRTPAPFKFNPSEAHGLQSSANYRYKIKDSKTGRFAKNGARQTGIHLPHADGFGAEFLAPHPGASGAEPGAQPGAQPGGSPVNSPVKITGDSPGSSPGEPSIHAGSSGLAPVQYSTRQNRTNEIRGESTIDSPSLNFSFFAGIAETNQIPLEFAKRIFDTMQANGFAAKDGKPIQNLEAYFLAAAKRGRGKPGRAGHVPDEPPIVKPKQAWQIEKDLATTEGRLKTLNGSWRPDPDLIKALNEKKKRLHAELRVALQTENQITQ